MSHPRHLRTAAATSSFRALEMAVAAVFRATEEKKASFSVPAVESVFSVGVTVCCSGGR